MKIIVCLIYLLGVVLPMLLVSSGFSDKDMLPGWPMVLCFLFSVSVWYLFAKKAKGRMTDFAVSPYYFAWAVGVFVLSGYYSMFDYESLVISPILTNGAFKVFVVAVIIFLFELFLPDKVLKIAKWMEKTMED